MRILVTGGTGLLGSAVCRRLVERGDRPIVFDVAPKPEQLGAFKSGCTLVAGDLLDADAVLAAMREHRPERIIHTAGMLTPGVLKNPEYGIRVNYLGTVRMLEAARQLGTDRLILCSSNTVYDHAQAQTHPIREDDPVLPRSIYATTKLAAEWTGINYTTQFGVPFAALRFAALYGPSEMQSGVAGLWIDPLLKSAVEHGRATVVRPTRKAMEYLYVEDAAEALIQAATAEVLHHPVYNVGEGRQWAFDDILELVRQTVPGVEIVEEATGRQTSPYKEARVPMDLSRAQADFGYTVQYPMPRALTHYVDTLSKRESGR